MLLVSQADMRVDASPRPVWGAHTTSLLVDDTDSAHGMDKPNSGCRIPFIVCHSLHDTRGALGFGSCFGSFHATSAQLDTIMIINVDDNDSHRVTYAANITDVSDVFVGQFRDMA